MISSLIVVISLSVFFAFLIFMFELLFLKPQEVDLIVNKDTTLKIMTQESLLQALNSQEIFISSGCGGRGTCGKCIVEVLEGGGPVLPTETVSLSKEDLDRHVRLACQVKVMNPLSVKIDPVLLQVKKYSVKVSILEDFNHDIKQVGLDLMGSHLSFKPGQYVQLTIPPYGKMKESISRAYSIASSPSRNTEIELGIRLVPEGEMTTYIHQFLKRGDVLEITGPYGEFILDETSSRDMICIAGGSGIAPIRSILSYLAEQQSDRNILFFFGALSKRDLLLLDEMEKFRQRLKNFQFIPALSKPLEEDQWKGDSGLITEVIPRYVKDASEMEAYLCGSPGMLKAASQTLFDLHLPQERFYCDPF